MKGSCFCGKCVFEIRGDIGSINKCHCTKCRKVFGAGSNAVFWIVPAGVMDENPNVKVRAHIFVESKPDWEIIGDDAPQFLQVPAE